MRSSHALSALALVVVALAPDAARACSGAPCSRTVSLVLPDSGVLPANVGELTTYDFGPHTYPAEAEVRVWEASDPANVLFRGNTAAKGTIPIGPLSVGKTYVAEVTPSCSWASESEKVPQRFNVQVGPASEPPTSLGALSLVRNGNAMVPWGGTSACWQDFKAAAAEVRLDPAALPEAWRELLTDYQLMVDGEPFSWVLMTGGNYWPRTVTGAEVPRGFYRAYPAAFQVWTACGPVPEDSVNRTPVPSRATPGKHTVWVRARVPSVDPQFVESERLEVELSCNESPPLPPQSPPGLVDTDAGERAGDAGEPFGDGAAPEHADDVDCSLSGAATDAPASAVVIGAIALLCVCRRRRSSSN